MIGLIILIALIRILQITHSPLLCAGINTALGFLFGFLDEMTFIARIGWGVFDFGYSFLFFYLLNQAEEFSKKWWAIILGFLVLPFALALAGI